MRVISDIHIHSRYSRACSRDLIPENLDKWGKIKGVNLLGTGDFTHPGWRAELRENLEEAESGFFKLRGADSGIRFVLSTEVACIYSQAEKKLRRIHYVLLVPSFAAAEKFAKSLESRGGQLASDGRPLLGMTSRDILKHLLESDEKALMIPAHAWTPYFGIFGSKSGFDSVEECFGDMSKYIYGFETGLSSDGAMNWRLSQNARFTIISASDAHSLSRIGREATVLEMEQDKFNYDEFFRIIKEKDKNNLKFTIEYFPEEGKYHLDGHGPCQVSFTPEQTKRAGGRCPKCGRKIIVGGISRVNDLADRPEGFVLKSAIPQKHLVPLEEVLSDCFGVGPKSKKVQEIYFKLIERAGNEFAVILDLPIAEVEKVAGSLIAEAVKRVREEKVVKIPGYDGVYGIIKVFTNGERKMLEQSPQIMLF